MCDKLRQQTCQRHHPLHYSAVFGSTVVFFLTAHINLFLNITTGTSTGGVKDVILPEQASGALLLDGVAHFSVSHTLPLETHKWF